MLRWVWLLVGCGRIDFDPARTIPVDAPVLPSPIAAYPLNEDAGQNVASSAGVLPGFRGDGPNMSPDDPTWVPGRFGSALSFDAVDDRVAIAYAPSGFFAMSTFNDAISISAWFRLTSQPATYRVIFEIGGESNCATLGLTDAGNVKLILRDTQMATSRFEDVESTLKPAIDVWYYVAGTSDAAGMHLYVYDETGTRLEHATGPGGLVWDTGTDGIGLGANPKGNSGLRGMLSTGFESFSGVVDEVRVYDVAISQAHVETDLRTPL